MSERLQKVMAHAGVASRRKAEKLIVEGHVKVNGKVVKELGTKVTESDEVEVDEVPISKEVPVYYLLYKPRGVITAVTDDKHRKTVIDLLSEVTERIYPVGRLDYDTSGLLLLTNDGDLDNHLTHPKYEVDKTYVAKVKGTITNDDMKKLRTGIHIDGRKTASAKATVIRNNNNSTIVSLTIHEGRNHQVKKMFLALGHPVEKLSRQSYGFLNLDGLQPGDYRRLKPHEVEELKKMSQDRKR
ncbi:pseudouridine synthase [Lentilactobacillus hilgardii]|uniref:pseudouridine synthase n=1 Tax=Lentilactobacillus hilgardii TaxID=1588 RepID=UPI0021C26D08|nr:pseudouridine synthase [Lentilactobacillus hilgardii]MCP9332199.1 rRNA pseudouridine synthase [Lentilactobacillus hilgardii]MCP9348829.1 rRNA pseudouridine synthase [Lentilactobacillus hilgardii]MCP9351592.1 rRNA pseudouridine synthase [Lentilactobacillus hilgardii]